MIRAHAHAVYTGQVTPYGSRIGTGSGYTEPVKPERSEYVSRQSFEDAQAESDLVGWYEYKRRNRL